MTDIWDLISSFLRIPWTPTGLEWTVFEYFLDDSMMIFSGKNWEHKTYMIDIWDLNSSFWSVPGTPTGVEWAGFGVFFGRFDCDFLGKKLRTQNIYDWSLRLKFKFLKRSGDPYSCRMGGVWSLFWTIRWWFSREEIENTKYKWLISDT